MSTDLVLRHSHALAQASIPRPEEVGSDFFRAVYSKARTGNDTAREQDRPSLEACMLSAAKDQGFALVLPEGRQAAIKHVGALISLGLEAAAEGEETAAIALLRAAALHEFYEIGRAMREEVAKTASQLLKRNLLRFGDSYYGVLEASAERRLASIAIMTHPLSSMAAYQETVAAHARDTRLLELAPVQFPFALIFEAHKNWSFGVRQRFQRPSEAEPSTVGGLLGLFVRSYFMRALTLNDTCPALPYLGNARKDFWDMLANNFTAEAEPLRQLVGNTFFEPAAVQRNLPEAADAYREYLKAEIYAIGGIRNFDKPAMENPQDLNLMLAHAKETFLAFAAAVKDRFVRSDEADVSDEEVRETWGAWIFIQSTKGGERGMDDSKLAASVVDPNTLLRIPPSLLKNYLRGAGDWSPEVKRRMRDEYPWKAYLNSDIQDGEKIQDLSVAVLHLGPEVLKPALVRFDLPFWMHAWSYGNDALRHAILRLFETGIFDARLAPRTLIAFSVDAINWQNDYRLLAYVFRRFVRDQIKDEVAGVGVKNWITFFHVFGRDKESARILWHHVPSKLRARVWEGLPTHTLASLADEAPK